MRTKILILILAGLVSYAFVFGAPFKTIDDHAAIINNPLIKNVSHIPDLFQSSYFGLNIYWRPLVFLTHMAEFHMFGLTPFFYYLTNVLINVAGAVVVYLILRLLVKNDTVAFFTALLFIIHPIHGTAVANISGRPVLLCGLFYLLSFYGYCRFRNNQRIPVLIFSVLSFVLALLSKESAVMLPVLLVFYEWVFSRGKKLKSTLSTWPYWIVLAVYFFARHSLGIVRLFEARDARAMGLQVLTFLRGVLTYARLFVYPTGLHFDRAMAILPGADSPAALITMAVFIVFIFALVLGRRKISPLVFFLTGWFFIELVPVSQIVAGILIQPGYIALSEHFVYTAAVGPFALMSMAGCRLAQFNKQRRWMSDHIFKTVVFGYLSLLLVVTVQQSIYAGSEGAMLARTLHYNPSNVRMRESYAWSFVKLHRLEEAEQQYRKLLELAPGHARARISLGKVLCDQGKYAQGFEEYRKVRNAGPLSGLLRENTAAALTGLIRRYQQAGDLERAAYYQNMLQSYL